MHLCCRNRAQAVHVPGLEVDRAQAVHVPGLELDRAQAVHVPDLELVRAQAVHVPDLEVDQERGPDRVQGVQVVAASRPSCFRSPM